ncbi:hypothetical protein CCP2SC5_130016 [Azospirillaceae bacterium]
MWRTRVARCGSERRYGRMDGSVWKREGDLTASESSPEPDAASHFDFQQLRLACELSGLREERERLREERKIIGADVGRFRAKVEEEVEALRQGLAALGQDGLSDPVRVMPLLERAVAALIEMRDYARSLDEKAPSGGPLFGGVGGSGRRSGVLLNGLGADRASGVRALHSNSSSVSVVRQTMPALPAFLAEGRGYDEGGIGGGGVC